MPPPTSKPKYTLVWTTLSRDNGGLNSVRTTNRRNRLGAESPLGAAGPVWLRGIVNAVIYDPLTLTGWRELCWRLWLMCRIPVLVHCKLHRPEPLTSEHRSNRGLGALDLPAGSHSSPVSVCLKFQPAPQITRHLAHTEVTPTHA